MNYENLKSDPLSHLVVYGMGELCDMFDFSVVTTANVAPHVREEGKAAK